MKITVVGSSNTDMVIRVPRIPAPGETILGGEFFIAAGGKGANQAVAAARAGGNVVFVACVGDDMFGAQAQKELNAEGIDTRCIFVEPDTPSGVAEIFVAENGENSIAVAPGANANLSPAHIKKCAQAIAQADILVVQLESPVAAVRQAIDIAHENNVPIILNPAPAQQLEPELLQKVTVITPNESEAELLTKQPVSSEESAVEAARLLHSMGIGSVIITMGDSGAYLSADDIHGFIPANKVKAVDTTAAGDVFTGTLAVAIAEGNGLHRAVQFASAAAALSVTIAGAQPSIPKRKQIDTFLVQR